MSERPTYSSGIPDNIFEIVRNAKEELEILVDSISDIFLLLTEDGHITRANQSIEAWGLAPIKESLGKSVHELFHPNCSFLNCHLPLYWKSALEAMVKNETFEYEIWDDFLNRHVHIKYSPISKARYFRGFDRSVYAVAIFRDITQLKHAQFQTAKSNAELQAIFEASPDQHVRIREDGTIVTTFQKQSDGSQWPLPDFSEGNIFQSLPVKVVGLFRRKLKSIHLEKNNEIFEYSMKFENSEHFFEARMFPTFEDHILLINRNITERKKLQAMAESINYTKTLGYLFSGIRHEIGNPINSIKMSLMVIKKNINKLPTERISDYIERALGEINRMEFLLQSFKSFNLYENVVLNNLDLPQFLTDFFTLMADDFKERGVTFSMKLDPEATTVYSNSRALHQVLLNLVSNAMDAMQDMQFAAVEASTRKGDHMVKIIIKDNGPGIHESILENLFKPFFTTKIDGTGLGLVIVKNIITRLSGDIDVQSKEGEGTAVIISLPEAGDD